MSIKRALLLAYCERYGNLLLGLIATMVLSRVLTPAEVGVFSIGVLIIGIIGVLRDLDATSFLIQTPELTLTRVRAAFSVSMGLGILFAVLLWVLSPQAAAFYHEPKLKDVMQLLAFNFLLVPFGANTQAVLTREMRFGALLIIRLSQPMVSATTSVTLALLGHGTMSLAWGMVAGSLTIALVSNLFRPRNFPLLPGVRGIKEVLHFGLRKTSASILFEFKRNGPEIIIGKTLGFAASALFSRANGLAQLFSQMIMDAIHQVALAHFSKNRRAKEDHSKQHYLFATQIILALAWPFFMVLGWNAHAVIYILYGAQWVGAASVLQILCISVSLTMPFALAGSLFIASGNVNMVFRIASMVAPIGLLLALVAAHHSTEAVAAAVLITALTEATICMHTLKHRNNIAWSDLQSAMRGALQLSAVAGLACGLGALIPVTGLTPNGTRVMHMLISSALSLLAYGYVLWRTQHPLLTLARSLLRKS